MGLPTTESRVLTEAKESMLAVNTGYGCTHEQILEIVKTNDGKKVNDHSR